MTSKRSSPEEKEYLLNAGTSSHAGEGSSSECTTSISVSVDTIPEGAKEASTVPNRKSTLESLGMSIVNLFSSKDSALKEGQGDVVAEEVTVPVVHSQTSEDEIQANLDAESVGSQDEEGVSRTDLPSKTMNTFDRIEQSFRALSRKLSASDAKQKVCVICLEPLSDEDFETGVAISLQCGCKGDMTYRHEACAVKWAQVKGSTLCDICKQPIENLPDIESLPPPDLVEPLTPHDIDYTNHSDSVPPALDLSFDFLRITWIATIVCVLLVQLDLQESLWVGSVVGLTYILIIKFIQCCSPRPRERQAINTLAHSREDVLSNSLSSPPGRSSSYNSTAWYGVVTPPV